MILSEYPGVPRPEVRAAVDAWLAGEESEASGDGPDPETWGLDPVALAEQEQSEAVWAGASYG